MSLQIKEYIVIILFFHDVIVFLLNCFWICCKDQNPIYTHTYMHFINKKLENHKMWLVKYATTDSCLPIPSIAFVQWIQSFFLTMYDSVRHRNWSKKNWCLAQNDLSLPSNSRKKLAHRFFNWGLEEHGSTFALQGLDMQPRRHCGQTQPLLSNVQNDFVASRVRTIGERL